MTDRVHALTVTLDRDIRVDDLEVDPHMIQCGRCNWFGERVSSVRPS